MKEQQGPIQLPHTQGEGVNHQQLRSFRNYDLIRRIDVGGMGEVYLAYQRSAFDRKVALKIIRSDLVHDQVARQRFLREAEVIAHLLHEHILTLIEFDEEDGRLFLVTPYIKGGTLARRLQRGPLALSEAYQLFTALVKAVCYVHRKGVVHRDLKPSNVLLDMDSEDGQVYVRLIDFGIASFSGAQAKPPLTTSGHEMGTAAYMAPERLDGIAAPSNDIYSLGVILYQMLTGTLPSAGRAAKIPPALYTVIRRCTAVHPDDRYVSADALLEAFEQSYQVAIQTSQAHQNSSSYPDLPAVEPKSSTSGHMPAVQPTRNEVLVHRSEFVMSPLPGKLGMLKPEEYEAPTTSTEPKVIQRAKASLAHDDAIKSKPSPRSKRRKRSLLGIITVLAIVAAMVYYLVFQQTNSANIVVMPRVQSISKVVTLNARPNLTAIDPATNSVPAYVLSSNKTGSLAGQTSGQTNCVLGLFNCRQAVSFTDIETLAAELKPGIRDQIFQDLQGKARTNQCTMVGNVLYTDGQVSSDPPVGSSAKTVTVAMTEQGSVECYKMQDVRSLALIELRQQLPQHYALIDQTAQVGQPVVRSVDDNGNVKVAIPVGGVERYQVSDQELAAIQSHVNGMKLKAARDYIATQPGLNATATTIHVTSGDTIPTNATQVHVTSVNPTNLPPVQLPKA